MGCCLFASVLAGAPRLAFLLWWLVQPARIDKTFSSMPGGFAWLWAGLGVLFLPWTTIMYVFVYPGGLSFVNWVFLGLALAVDIGSYGGGEYGRRNR
jgi:hypothetical protein